MKLTQEQFWMIQSCFGAAVTLMAFVFGIVTVVTNISTIRKNSLDIRKQKADAAEATIEKEKVRLARLQSETKDLDEVSRVGMFNWDWGQAEEGLANLHEHLSGMFARFKRTFRAMILGVLFVATLAGGVSIFPSPIRWWVAGGAAFALLMLVWRLVVQFKLARDAEKFESEIAVKFRAVARRIRERQQEMKDEFFSGEKATSGKIKQMEDDARETRKELGLES